jgi:hypothetical protein
MIGEMCPPCLDYLNRRKRDASDPTGGPVPSGNWPAREWPTVEDLEEARRRYPEAMFPDDAPEAVAPGWATRDVIYEESVIWKMERETA